MAKGTPIKKVDAPKGKELSLESPTRIKGAEIKRRLQKDLSYGRYYDGHPQVHTPEHRKATMKVKAAFKLGKFKDSGFTKPEHLK
jgi:hypothetical protein